MPQLYLIDPFSAERIGLSQSHLVPETLGSKVGVTFHQNVISVFKHFVLIFSLIFDQVDPFFVGLRSFDPYFYKTLDPIGSIFCGCLTLPPPPLTIGCKKVIPLGILSRSLHLTARISTLSKSFSGFTLMSRSCTDMRFNSCGLSTLVYCFYSEAKLWGKCSVVFTGAMINSNYLRDKFPSTGQVNI